MLKKLLLALAICHLPFAIARAQFASTIDTTTLTTNSYTLTFTLTVTNPATGFGFTNGAAMESNTNYIVVGDPPLTESFKINQGFTNAWLWAMAQSNFTLQVSGNFTVVSNNFLVISNHYLVTSNILATTTNRFAALTNAWASFIGGYSPGGGGNVNYGGPMMFDFDGTTTNIASDGHGNVGQNGLTVTNLETVYLPDDTSDPPSSFGVQWLSPDNELPVFLAHGYSSGDIFPVQDYITYGLNIFSWSMIDGPTSTRWGYLNVDEQSGTTIQWYYAADNGKVLSCIYNGQLQWDSGAATSDFYGGLSLANGAFVCDDSGNVTATTFLPVSDRNLKEQIKPLAPTDALDMVLSLTNYSWRFKSRTNYVTVSTPNSLSTNLQTFTRTNRFGLVHSHIISVVTTNSFSVVTNVAKILPASGTEFGPMAQDWHAATGLQDGHRISATSESGLLIGAVQGLAALQGVLTNAAGARFHLVVNARTNGFIFVPQ